MDKKKLTIFVILGLFAVLCAFIVVSAFTPKNSKNKNTKDSEVYTDIDTYLKDKLSEQKTEDEEDVKTNQALDITNVSNNENTDTQISTDDENLSVYEKYLKEAEIEGTYDLSDVGNTILDEYEITLKRKASNEDIEFFNNLKTLADNYTMAYEEAFSYVLSSDMKTLEEYIEGAYSDAVDDFQSLETNGDEKFQKIKNDYYNGMSQAREGFRAYISNPDSDDCNEYFFNADEYFYNGQNKLIELLDEYK